MNNKDKQIILDVLNNLEVIESNGGDSPYILVANNNENQKKLNKVGVSNETINKYGEDRMFCVLALAFSERYADDFVNGEFVVWEELVNDELRHRVLAGEGTATDAERLLKALEPNL